MTFELLCYIGVVLLSMGGGALIHRTLVRK